MKIRNLAPLLLLLSASPALAQEGCTEISSPKPAISAGHKWVTVRRAYYVRQGESKLRSILIRADIHKEHARIDTEGVNARISQVKECAGGQVQYRVLVDEVDNKRYHEAKIPLPADLRDAITFRNCNPDTQKCYVGVYDGTSTAPIILKEESRG